MKRLLLICVISLLFVSGWGHVLAAAFCPSMQDMPGCAMKTESSSASTHEGHDGMEMGDTQNRPTATENRAGAVKRPLVSCCASRSQVPPAPVVARHGAKPSKQNLGALLKSSLKALTEPTPSFAPPVASRQHAPPGAATSRHVLINVFLI